ncbi:arginine-tRNA ligase [Aphanomyces invadans]|uniref:arginine--tRNA ligase n=1 Tax=Aphanomyces invadans TaxID=157072 RepID=A0A024UPK2_9STRA|nr:arginine-tRNA ligase [Aphanomyces invadans]ETW07548.1 arginine-tRNA ligase [Aphanomyces invadans]|eukprot:XP_008863641.1 arginine-tRNA ligase [Aphanomyces invadans]
MAAAPQPLVLAAHGYDALKCVIALNETQTPFTLKVNSSTAHLTIPATTTQPATTLSGANVIARYVAFAAGALAADDLAVDEWLEWEKYVLRVTLDKTALSTLIETKIKSATFAVGNSLTLADVVVGVALRKSLEWLPQASYPLATARAYVAALFARPAFASAVTAVIPVAAASTSPQAPTKKSLATDAQLLGKTYDHVLGLIEALFVEAVDTAFPGMLDRLQFKVEVSRTKMPKFGDYQCTSSMSIFTALKGSPNAPGSPRDVALAIIAAMPTNPVIEKLSVAGPGFINAFLTAPFVANRLELLLQQGVQASPIKKQKVVVDFSSPNTAKDMHVGHLRSTIIGDAMCRILEFQGHEVLRINHVGDWGTQFGMLITHLTEAFPTWKDEMPDITNLTQLYKNAKQRFDEDEDFHKRSKDGVVKLQAGDADSLEAWRILCEVSRKEYQKVYDRLDVRLDEMGESFYNPIIPRVIEMVEAQGITQDSDGAKVVFTSKYKQPFMLVKSDGSYLYDTTDIAALWYRLHELKADWIIIYTDYTQQDHFGLLFEVGAMAKILDPAKHRVNHIGFGTVNDESGKRFKTRSGETVRLVDLLDESKARMKVSLQERIAAGQTTLPEADVDHAAELIGYGAVKYFDLMRSPQSNYVFNYDKMLSTNGNTAVYLMFAYARLSSIVRKSGVDMDVLSKQSGVVKVTDPNEAALAVELLQLQDVLVFINKELATNWLCTYLYTLSEKVQVFVTQCRVLGSPEQNSRLLLCQATLKIMHTCFKLLGISPLDQI